MLESLLLKISRTTPAFQASRNSGWFLKATLPCVHNVLLAFENKNTSTGDTHCSIRAQNPESGRSHVRHTPITNTQKNPEHLGDPAALTSNCSKSTKTMKNERGNHPTTKRNNHRMGRVCSPSLRLSLNNLITFLLDKAKLTCQMC